MFKLLNGENLQIVNEIFCIRVRPLMYFYKDRIFISPQLILFSERCGKCRISRSKNLGLKPSKKI